MSRVAELAREEAERSEVEEVEEPETPDAPVEPDTGDEEAEGAEETPEQPEAPEPPVQALTEAQIEARVASWERERDRHFRELRKRDAERYDGSEVCPLCDGHGMFWPQLPEPDQTTRREGIHMLLGAYAEPELPMDPHTEPCPDCEGHGKTRTGAVPPAEPTRVCPNCTGSGFKVKVETAPLFTPPLPQPLGGAPANGTTATGMPNDPWQRPWGHADYGKPPAMVNS